MHAVAMHCHWCISCGWQLQPKAQYFTRRVHAGLVVQAAVLTTKINVFGICCPAEVPVIQKLLRGLPGVTAIEVLRHFPPWSVYRGCSARCTLAAQVQTGGTRVTWRVCPPVPGECAAAQYDGRARQRAHLGG